MKQRITFPCGDMLDVRTVKEIAWPIDEPVLAEYRSVGRGFSLEFSPTVARRIAGALMRAADEGDALIAKYKEARER